MTSLTTSGDVHTVVGTELVDDRYRLIALLHRADDTETWQAHDARLGRDVIVELMPPVLQLPQWLSSRPAERGQVYDAGSHTWRGDRRTFVVTTVGRDATSSTYRPRHSVREPLISATLDEQPPLSVGNWEFVNRVRRRPRLRPTDR